MKDVFTFIFFSKIIAFVLGVMLIYLSFLYEDEEKRIKNWFTDAWLKLDESDRTFTQKLNAILSNYHMWFTRNLDSLFGSEVLSKRSVFISYCLSIISVYGVLLIYHIGKNFNKIIAGTDDEKLEMRVAICMGQIFITSIMAKHISENETEIKKHFWPLFLLTAGSFFPILSYTFGFNGMGTFIFIAYIVLFPLFIATSIAFVMGIRFASKRVSKNINLLSKILIFLVSLLFAVILSYPVWSFQIRNSNHGFSYAFYLSASNMYVFLIALTYLFIFLFHFVNFILWNTFKRPIYMLHQNDFLKYRYILSFFGVALMGYVWKDGADWISKFFFQ